VRPQIIKVSSKKRVLPERPPSTAFAKACIDIVRNQDLNQKIARNGRQYIENRLTWAAIRPTVEEALQCAMQEPRPA